MIIIVIIKTAILSSSVNIKQVIDSVVWWLNYVLRIYTRLYVSEQTHTFHINKYSYLWIVNKSKTHILYYINLAVLRF